MLYETGCDGLMIARGAKGNPWIFSRTLHYLENRGTVGTADKEELKETILRHAQLQTSLRVSIWDSVRCGKHLSWYTVGLPHSSSLRNDVNQTETWEDFYNLIQSRI